MGKRSLHACTGLVHTIAGVNVMKEEEKKSIPWEAADPKLPVVQSGHMENRRHNAVE